MHGSHLIKSCPLTQSGISLSSGEAEYYALVKGASCVLGIQAMMKELRADAQVRIKTDAIAAVGIASRRGLGKVKHIDVTQLWTYDKVAEKKIKLQQVGTKENVADALTKGISHEEMEWHVQNTTRKGKRRTNKAMEERIKDSGQEFR